MTRSDTLRLKRLRREMSMTGVIVALSVGVILPVVLSTSVGIVTLALGQSSGAIVIGVLVICFAAAAIGGIVAVTVLLQRRARLARLQADFVANVTHELRTPLAAIRMYAQTLQMGRLENDPRRTAECLDTILRETEWLEAMIDRVLTWRAAAKDRAALAIEVAPVGRAIVEAIERFGRMVAPGEVDFEMDISTMLPVAHDRSAVSSVLLNLLTNAYKYTGKEKRIRVLARDAEKSVEIAVEDNGCGVPEREAARIFEPFYRVESRDGSRAAGAGLGLAIARYFVKAHGGEISVESVPGQGSRFVVKLPVASREDVQ